VPAVAERVAFFDVMACLTAPVAHFVVVLTPGMNGMITDGDLGLVSSLAFEIGGLVHVVVNVATDVRDGIGGGELF